MGGRLTIISPFAPEDRRASADLGRRRNLFIMALADEIVFGFIAPGGSFATKFGHGKSPFESFTRSDAARDLGRSVTSPTEVDA